MIKDTSRYDAVLLCNCNDMISEAHGDQRIYAKTGYGGDSGNTPPYTWYDDPKLYASNAFGKMILADLNGWKAGYSAKVTDFGKWVVVDVTHHNHLTGRSSSKTFLIVFDGGPKGTYKDGGMVLSTANKWRTISGYSQAVSYIKSAVAALESSSEQKI